MIRIKIPALVPADGDTLVYDAASDGWSAQTPAQPSTGGVGDRIDLSLAAAPVGAGQHQFAWGAAGVGEHVGDSITVNGDGAIVLREGTYAITLVVAITAAEDATYFQVRMTDDLNPAWTVNDRRAVVPGASIVVSSEYTFPDGDGLYAYCQHDASTDLTVSAHLMIVRTA